MPARPGGPSASDDPDNVPDTVDGGIPVSGGGRAFSIQGWKSHHKLFGKMREDIKNLREEFETLKASPLTVRNRIAKLEAMLYLANIKLFPLPEDFLSEVDAFKDGWWDHPSNADFENCVTQLSKIPKMKNQPSEFLRALVASRLVTHFLSTEASKPASGGHSGTYFQPYYPNPWGFAYVVRSLVVHKLSEIGDMNVLGAPDSPWFRQAANRAFPDYVSPEYEVQKMFLPTISPDAFKGVVL